MSNMPVVRATLVQSIRELQDVLKPYLDVILERYSAPGLTYEGALGWVLAEEIEQIYWLFDTQHHTHRFHQLYAAIYQDLRNSLPIALSRYVGHYVAAPRIYSDHNLIDLEVRGFDLYMGYYRNPYEPLVIESYPS